MPYLSPIFLRRLLQNYDFALNVGTSLCDVVLEINSLHKPSQDSSLRVAVGAPGMAPALRGSFQSSDFSCPTRPCA